ncbi:MAG: cytochrome c3 family protein [Candidatus Eisenbacteria bacterium]|nr:cytochrome c3 family protein [Candidatus Eisenbacteria bacterium]
MSRLCALILVLLACASSEARAVTNAECLECHRDPSLTLETADGKQVSLYVGAAEFSSSVHGELSCTDCHADIAEVPHAEALQPVDCATCHSDVKAVYDASLHGQATTRGNTDAPGCADCHGTHTILPASNPASKTHAFNLVGTCAQCHADPAVVKRSHIGAKAPVEAYMKSIHGKALLQAGNPEAPNCSACHPAHEMLPAGDSKSTVNRSNVALTCGQCHGEVYEVYSESVHGKALAAGYTDAPTCTDCHGEHDIEGPSSPTSSVYPANLVKTTCVRCHDSLVLARRYGFSVDRGGSFRETYHGLAGKKGDLSVANCASCHGIHNIFEHDDPRSTVHPANLTATCGQCHPNASDTFAAIQVHPTGNTAAEVVGATAEDAKKLASSRAAHVVRSVYVYLIVFVIGGMILHNIILWLFHVREKRKRELAEGRVRRFSKFEVWEHKINLIAFFGLVFTGFALKFPDAGWVRMSEQLGMSETIRGNAHRVLAVVMIAVGITHTCFFLFTRRGRNDLMGLRFGIRDIQDMIQNLRYHLGMSKTRPTFPRFDYTEKAEYLALIWGTSVMILTGLILWFPTLATRHLPTWSFPVAEVVHYYEAWLAFLAIVVWHLYFVVASPEAYPMNLTWMDGETTERQHAEKHGHGHSAAGGGGFVAPAGAPGGEPSKRIDPSEDLAAPSKR